MANPRNRLQGKVAVLTGGGGEIGKVIARRYLEEGATIILSGRTQEKLRAAVEQLEALNPAFHGKVGFVIMDGSDPKSVTRGAKELAEKYQKIDILINNAGTAGPRQTLRNIPIDGRELKSLQDSGAKDTETLPEAIGSLLGSPWFTTLAFLPYLGSEASIINVSTIFSLTPYYGRIAYVVPKAALNALSKCMAAELGQDPRRIRVNTVFPGPVEGERISTVFAAMDRLKKAPEGTTSKDITSRMVLGPKTSGGSYLSKEEIADTVVFLGSDESKGHSSHGFEVTRGLRVPDDRESRIVNRPDVPRMDLSGRFVWILAGDQFEDANEMALRHLEKGADVLVTFCSRDAVQRASTTASQKILYDLFDTSDESNWKKIQKLAAGKKDFTVVVLPRTEAVYDSLVCDTEVENVHSFLINEISYAVAISRGLDRFFFGQDSEMRRPACISFVTNASDNVGNAYQQIRSAAIQELIRVWRHEAEFDVRNGGRSHPVRLNQLVRYKNSHLGNLDLASEWIITLSCMDQEIGPIDLVLDPGLDGVFEGVELEKDEYQIRGLHSQKVVMVTGGSEGIGGEITRQMALAGAKIVIAERSSEKLARISEKLTNDMRRAGYPDSENRLLVIPNCDMTREQDLVSIVDQAVQKFGKFDYLVNNAGLTGGEIMAVDLSPESWEKTLNGNMISNYHLMLRALPQMKVQGEGHIVNMSSYFGGSRHGDVAYPNRSDYAVSKAGQMAMAEAFSPYIGPEIQINVIAPGPVDGARLNGTYGRPGLYERRALLIIESRRLNGVYKILIEAIKRGEPIELLLEVLKTNEIEVILSDLRISNFLRVEIRKLAESGPYSEGNASKFLVCRTIADKLLDRLFRAGVVADKAATAEFLAGLKDPPEPFFSKTEAADLTRDIRKKITPRFALGRMPTDRDLAIEVVTSLARRTVTGEVLYPTCGFHYDGYKNLGESFLYDGTRFSGESGISTQIDVSSLAGRNIMIFGDSAYEDMAAVAVALKGQLLEPNQKVVLSMGSETGASLVRRRLKALGCEGVQVHFDPSQSLEKVFDARIREFGEPGLVISFPMRQISVPMNPNVSAWRNLPSLTQFKQFVADHLTNHFLLSRRASLVDNCRVIFITGKLYPTATEIERSVLELLKSALRPFTLSVGKEAEHLVHKPIFGQVSGDQPTAAVVRTVLRMALYAGAAQEKDGSQDGSEEGGSGLRDVSA